MVIFAALFALVGGYLSYARVSGTRGLPSEVHQGLMPDHVNYALSWFAGAALASLLLALWAAAVPEDHGRSLSLCLGLVLFAAVALTTVLKFWTGPPPFRFPSMTGWLARRRDSRGNHYPHP